MTNRSLQETVELVIFGLIALLVGLAVLWVTGWILSLLGSLFMIVASFVWNLLRFILPVIVIAAVVYLIVRYATRGDRRPASAGSTRAPSPPPVRTITEPPVTEPAPASRASEPLREPINTEPRTVEAEPVPRPAPTEPPSDLPPSDLEPPARTPREPEER